MKIISKRGKKELATVYIGEINGKKIEFVESLQPPLSIDKKWVIIVSTLYGCPVKCKICDAGGNYKGPIKKEDIISQIQFLILNRFGELKVPSEKFKIQFSRIGEPSFNLQVLDVLEELPQIINAPSIIPSLSTIAPIGTDRFFDKLLKIKKELYKDKFQLQFSIHTTDEKLRDYLIPVKKWDFEKIAEYGKEFFEKKMKITLNFALSDFPVEAKKLITIFSPDIFLIKITPVNPTFNAIKNKLNIIEPTLNDLRIKELKEVGYEVLLSIGEYEENLIGSNCGQFITEYERFYDKNQETKFPFYT